MDKEHENLRGSPNQDFAMNGCDRGPLNIKGTK